MDIRTLRMTCLRFYRELREFDLDAYAGEDSRDAYFLLTSRMTAFLESGCALFEPFKDPEKRSTVTIDTETFNRRADDAMALDHYPGRLAQIADLSVALILYKMFRIRAIGAGVAWLEFLDLIASARRCLIKSVVALENCIAESLDVRPALDFYSEVQRGLLVRRLYADFRHAMRATKQRQGVEFALRAARGRIGLMLRLDAFEHIRFSDRRLLAGLNQRLLQCYTRPRSQRELESLFSDISASANLLMEINQRQELIQYDQKSVRRCLTAIEDGRIDLVPALVHDLIGRSAELDALVIDAIPKLARLKSALTEMSRRLELGRTGFIRSNTG